MMNSSAKKACTQAADAAWQSKVLAEIKVRLMTRQDIAHFVGTRGRARRIMQDLRAQGLATMLRCGNDARYWYVSEDVPQIVAKNQAVLLAQKRAMQKIKREKFFARSRGLLYGEDAGERIVQRIVPAGSITLLRAPGYRSVWEYRP